MSELLRPLLQSALPDWLIVLLASLLGVALLIVVALLLVRLLPRFEQWVAARLGAATSPTDLRVAALWEPSAASGIALPFAVSLLMLPLLLVLAAFPWARGFALVNLSNGLVWLLSQALLVSLGALLLAEADELLPRIAAIVRVMLVALPLVVVLLSAVVLTGTLSLVDFPIQQGGIPLVPFFGDAAPYAPLPDLNLGWLVFTPVGLVGLLIFSAVVMIGSEGAAETDALRIITLLARYGLAFLAAVIFLGGWQGPGVSQVAALGGLVGAIAAGLLSALYLQFKIGLLLYGWARWRGMVLQLAAGRSLAFALTWLLPLALANLLGAVLWVAIHKWGVQAQWSGDLAIAGISLLGWLAGATQLLRQLTAIVVSLLVQAGVWYWLLRRVPPADVETAAEEVA